jgi:hypothetical protein
VNVFETVVVFHSSRVISTLPPFCHPIDVLESRIGFTRHLCPALAPYPSSSPTTSFQRFISVQPTWVRRFLQTLQPELHFGSIFQLLHNTNSRPVAVCDGSVQSSQGTFGWVLAASRPRRTLLRCRGSVCGAFMDSYRAQSCWSVYIPNN